VPDKNRSSLDLLADFDNSLMPDCDQGFVKIAGWFSHGGRSMLCNLRLRAMEGPLCHDLVVECCGSVASHFRPSLFIVLLGEFIFII
jgi:hypothetical protein